MSNHSPVLNNTASDTTAFDNFIQKWRQRWPEWQWAEIFIPTEQRTLVLAWFTLLQEWNDCLNCDGDPTPSDAKLQWWCEELLLWKNHRSRHPLARVLEPISAPWHLLAENLLSLKLVRNSSLNENELIQQLLPFAISLTLVEDVLFGEKTSENNGYLESLLVLSSEEIINKITTESSNQATSVLTIAMTIARHILVIRLLQLNYYAVPILYFPKEEHNSPAPEIPENEESDEPISPEYIQARQQWAQQLQQHWNIRNGVLPRRIWAGVTLDYFKRWQVAANQTVSTVNPLRTIFSAWKAGRGYLSK